MKRPTLEQLDFLYVILQIIGIFLLGIIFKKDINSRDEWIGKNEINIQKYSATVLSCTKKNQRNMYYEIEVELSTGKLLVFKDEQEMSGTVDVYGINIDNKSYYAFSKEGLHGLVRKNHVAMMQIVIMLPIVAPILIYYCLRKYFGYPIEMKTKKKY